MQLELADRHGGKVDCAAPERQRLRARAAAGRATSAVGRRRVSFGQILARFCLGRVRARGDRTADGQPVIDRRELGHPTTQVKRGGVDGVRGARHSGSIGVAAYASQMRRWAQLRGDFGCKARSRCNGYSRSPRSSITLVAQALALLLGSYALRRSWLRPLGGGPSVIGRSPPPAATVRSSCGGSVPQAGRPRRFLRRVGRHGRDARAPRGRRVAASSFGGVVSHERDVSRPAGRRGWDVAAPRRGGVAAPRFADRSTSLVQVQASSSPVDSNPLAFVAGSSGGRLEAGPSLYGQARVSVRRGCWR